MTNSPAAPVISTPASRQYSHGGFEGFIYVNVPPLSFPFDSFDRSGPVTPFGIAMLLRKEVIQPHLPVRLPCYDFVPITSPTFDGSSPYGLGHRLRVLPTFVT